MLYTPEPFATASPCNGKKSRDNPNTYAPAPGPPGPDTVPVTRPCTRVTAVAKPSRDPAASTVATLNTKLPESASVVAFEQFTVAVAPAAMSATGPAQPGTAVSATRTDVNGNAELFVIPIEYAMLPVAVTFAGAVIVTATAGPTCVVTVFELTAVV